MSKLPIPENIPLRWELFRGFGWPETVKSAVAALAVLALCAAAGAATGNEAAPVITGFAVLFTLMLCAGFFTRVEGQSISGYLQKQRRYLLQQQSFRFQQKEVITIVSDEKDEG